VIDQATSSIKKTKKTIKNKSAVVRAPCPAHSALLAEVTCRCAQMLFVTDQLPAKKLQRIHAESAVLVTELKTEFAAMDVDEQESWQQKADKDYTRYCDELEAAGKEVRRAKPLNIHLLWLLHSLTQRHRRPPQSPRQAKAKKDAAKAAEKAEKDAAKAAEKAEKDAKKAKKDAEKEKEKEEKEQQRRLGSRS
jgi:hypothetical protein